MEGRHRVLRCRPHNKYWRYLMPSHSTTRPGPKPKPFWSYVNFNGPPWEGSRCWIWTGGRRGRDHHLGRGYGVASWNGKQGPAHRRAYELVRGPIPEGLTTDHLCRTTLCVNPFHLEPVTNKVNILRGESLAAKNARKTHCIRGHPFDESNTYSYPHGRHCKSCTLARNRKYAKEKRGTS
jgi:hypothetical protein